MCQLVNSLLIDDYEVIFCTGRRESVRSKTEVWIVHNIDYYLGYNKIKPIILMRSDDDHRHDTEVKPELLTNSGIELDSIAFVLEDRNSMVKKWRELGLICLQVAEGDF